jgi:dTDP-4-dehydrorhamnose reductase
MKILLTGVNGQLGTDLCRALEGHEVIGLTHAEVDITDQEALNKVCRKYRPAIIINTAAFVRVDDCEDDPDRAFSVNALGARNVAVIALELGAKLIHISTDYVFGSETKPRAIPYTEFDFPEPLNIYGRSKLAGEDFVRHICPKHFIVRSSGLFGTAGSSGKGGNFIETIIRLAKERTELKIVDDQVFSPTYTKDVAAKIVQLLNTELYGIYHVTNKGICSWYEFTKEILQFTGSKTRVLPITSSEYPQKARRPPYSVLGHYHLKLMNMDDLPTWREALKNYLIEKGYLIN